MEPSGRTPQGFSEPVHVRSADGSLRPYDPLRVRAGVERAQARVQDDDPWFASEVEEVVRLALSARYSSGGSGRRVWDVDEIEELVEEALIEMGRAKVARAYIVEHDRRARAREALRVVADPARTSTRPASSPALHADAVPLVDTGRVDDGDAQGEAWSPGRIVASLLRETELPREIAEQVSARVEERILGAGWRRVTGTFVRELVGNELAAMGFDDARRRQSPISVSRHDLAARLRDRGQALSRLEASVAGDVFDCMTREDVLDDGTRAAHREGAIHVEDLRRPQLPLVRALPVGLLMGGRAGASSALRCLERVAVALARTGRLLSLEQSGALCSRLLGQRGRRAGPLGDWLRALGALEQATGRGLLLAPPGATEAFVIARLVRELAEALAGGDSVPRLALTWAELEPALRISPEARRPAEELLAAGGLIPIQHGSSRRWIAPGLWRGAHDANARLPQVLQGAVCLPLPRMARRAGPWCEEALMSALVERIATAAQAVASLDAFQNELRGSRGEAAREARRFALIPVGLREALRILGDGHVDPTQGARVLGVMAEATQREGSARRLSLGVTPFFAERAAQRFARIDAAQRRSSQARLFVDMPVPEDELELAYSTGFAGVSEEESATVLGTELARLHAGLPCVALWPFPNRALSSSEMVAFPRLSTWASHSNAHSAGIRGAASPAPPVDGTGASAPHQALFDDRASQYSAGPLFDGRLTPES